MKLYTIKSVKKWGQDNIYSVTFEEANGEPTDFFDPPVEPRVGDKVPGNIEEYTTSTGSVRRKFVTQEAVKQEDRRQLEINTSWAIGLATQISPSYEPITIKETAKMLLDIKKELLS